MSETTVTYETPAVPAYELRARAFWRGASLQFGAFAVLILGKWMVGLDPVTPLDHALGYAMLALTGAFLGHRPMDHAGDATGYILTIAYGVLGLMAVALSTSGLFFANALNPVEIALLAATSAVAFHVGFTRG